MLKFTKDHYPDSDLYDERINSSGIIYFDKERAQNILKYQESLRGSRRRQAEKIMKVNSSNQYKRLEDESILDYLENVEFCPSYRFNSKKNAKGYTLSMDKVLKPLLADGYAKEFLKPYTEYKSMKTICSRIKSLTEGLIEPTAKNIEGVDLYPIKFTANPQFNLRFNYKDYDIITIPKAYNSCICVPNGYYMVWGDFNQSDLRIAYNVLLRDKDNAKVMDEMMEKYNDMYAGMAKLVADRNGQEFDYEKFRKDRDKFKVNVLAPIYGQEQGKTEEDAKFVAEMNSFLATCPRYQEFRTRLEDWMDLNLPLVVTSYFGHEEIIPKGYDRNACINTALNSPIQTGTSEVVISITNIILDKFYELGYTEDEVRLYYTRHDEPIFIIKQEALKDAWIFKECSKILIDNWTPLELEFHFGFRYKEVAEQVEKRVQNIYELNADKITNYEMDTSDVYDYLPVPKILKMNVGKVKLGDKQTIIAIYNEDSNSVKYYSAETVDDNSIVTAIRAQVIASTKEIYDLGYKSVLLYNDILDFEAFENSVYIKGKYLSNNGVGKANILAMFYADYQYPGHEDSHKMMSIFNANKSWMQGIKNIKYNKFEESDTNEGLQE